LGICNYFEGTISKNDSQQVMKELSEKGIGTRPFFYPMHQQPVLKRWVYSQKRAIQMQKALSTRLLYTKWFGFDGITNRTSIKCYA
jgi:dTDP-4-amino-4,6-dideoxygalactose transaminase